MKIVFVSDSHIGAGYNIGISKVFDGYLMNSRLIDFYQSLMFVIDEAIRVKASKIIHCGDVFKTKNPSSFERYMFAKIIKKVVDANIEFIILAGNHDYTGKGVLPSFLPESIISKVRCIDKYTTIILKEFGVDLHFLPWNIPLPDQVEKLFGGFSILVGHLTVEGASLGYFDYVMNETEIKKELFDPFNLVLLGHIHKPQQIGKKIFYVGATDRVDFAEKDDVKRFFVFDCTKKELTSVPIPTRQMIQLDVDLTKAAAYDFPVLDSECLVKVQITYNHESKQRALKLLNYVKEKGYYFSLKAEGNSKREFTQKSFDYSDAIKQYINTKVKDEALNKLVTQKSLSILKEVISENE